MNQAARAAPAALATPAPAAALAAVAALAALGAAEAVRAQPADSGWIDRERLVAGDVVQQAATEKGTVTIDLAIEIDADWRSIWDVLKACELAPEYVPNVRDCRSIDAVDDGRSELFMQTVKPAFFLPKIEHVFRLDYHPPERIDINRVSGPIEVLEGGWRLLPGPDGTITLIHSLTVNPGFPVPRFFVRNTMRRDLPDVLREVRERAERAAVERRAAAGELAGGGTVTVPPK